MKYRDETAFRQALQQRLKDRADGDGALLVRNRKRVAFDRLLVRLLAVAQEQWVLKGGFALDLRLAARARSTKDVDIEWRTEETELLDVLLDAANYDAGDFFELAIERAGVPEDRLGGSHRFRVSASLAGRSFESFLLDVDLITRTLPSGHRFEAAAAQPRGNRLDPLRLRKWSTGDPQQPYFCARTTTRSPRGLPCRQIV